jgi:hypothetical protein
VWGTRNLVLTVALGLAAPGLANGEIRTTGLFAPADPVGVTPPAPTGHADPEVLQLPAPTEEKPPAPPSTGFPAFVKTTGADFVALPQRTSTWVILGVGAASALIARPADDTANAHVVGSPAVGRFFAPGKWIGSVWVQAGASIGLYLGGRYLVPHVDGQPRTNKLSHLGYDLLRAQIVSQVFVHPGSAAPSRLATPQRRSPRRRCWNAISVTAPRGRRCSSRRMSVSRACMTTGIFSVTSSLAPPSAWRAAGPSSGGTAATSTR